MGGGGLGFLLHCTGGFMEEPGEGHTTGWLFVPCMLQGIHNPAHLTPDFLHLLPGRNTMNHSLLNKQYNKEILVSPIPDEVMLPLRRAVCVLGY